MFLLKRHRTIFLLPLLFLILLPACAKKSSERRFDFKGKVISVNAKDHQVIVSHEAIPGYMGAMTMPFTLKDDWALRVVKPGDELAATLVVEGGFSWLEHSVVSEQTVDPNAPKSGSVHIPNPGDGVPDFELINQDGKKVHLSDFRGGPVVLTFIYTRCPLPDYCPLMSENFARLDKLIRSDPALSAKAHLLSVTIDPEFDTSAVLKQYGNHYLSDAGDTGFNRWEFATGTAKQIKDVAEFFGLTYLQQNGQIVHSLSTAVIGPDGKLVKLFTGNQWKPDEITATLKDSNL